MEKLDKTSFKEFLLDPVSLRRDVRNIMKTNFTKYLTPDMTAYDIGCGDKPFAGFLTGKVKSYIGVDVEDGFYDSSYIDMIGTAYDVPIAAGQADAVISCQVLEHLQKPIDAIREKSRVLRQGGILFISFPFMYPIHAAPVDYFRYTEFAAQNFLTENGFVIIETERISGFWYSLALYSGIYLKIIDRGFLRKFKIAAIVNMLVKWFFYIFHKLEESACEMAGKKVDTIRRDWTVNYVLVARKL